MKKVSVLLLLLSMVTFAAYGACNFLSQMPASSSTDPDKHRGAGRCNEDNDCSQGYRCTSFGFCEYCG